MRNFVEGLSFLAEKKTYYIQVEAVNLRHFVFDTHDISTIRGGSYILLESIRQLSEEIKNSANTISKAASVGLFEFHGTEKQLEKLVQKIYIFLHNFSEGHATFVVATQENIEGDFQLVLETLQAKIRRDQWRRLTVAIPDQVDSDQECYMDGWRPGVSIFNLGTGRDNVKISQSTHFRREKGREIKHNLFYQLLGDNKYKDNLCAKDLGLLASDRTKGNANRKIAFIHLDGNDFGKIRHEKCTTPELRSEFDRLIQEEFLNEFLRELLEKADTDPDFITTDEDNQKALRLEVLLWGGDEIILVVPAWKGWQVMELFYQKAKYLQFQNIPLTYKGSLVFCHHNAPILQIRRLAEDLQYKAKESIRKIFIESGGSKNAYLSYEFGNAFHYLVLESFDMLKGTLDSFIDSYYITPVFSNFLIPYNEFTHLSESLQVLHREIPRGKLLNIIQILQRQRVGDNQKTEKENSGLEEAVEQELKKFLSLKSNDVRPEIEKNIHYLTDKALDRWYLLGDLWDYIPYWEEV